MKQSNILWWQVLYAQVWGDLVKRQFLYTHILMSVGFRRYLFMNDFLPGCVCYCNLMFYDWNLEWMRDECTWHHKTFPVQLYWHLAIKLYLAPQNIPSAIVLTLGNKAAFLQKYYRCIQIKQNKGIHSALSLEQGTGSSVCTLPIISWNRMRTLAVFTCLVRQVKSNLAWETSTLHCGRCGNLLDGLCQK